MAQAGMAALVAQAIAAPVIFAPVSWFYFTRFHYTRPLATWAIYPSGGWFDLSFLGQTNPNPYVSSEM